MSNREEWTTVNKSDWGQGPWLDEPDKVLWVDDETGLDCMIKRHPRSGRLCGYVGVPNGHREYGKDWENVAADVHGGLTYSATCEEPDDPAKMPESICHVPLPGRPHDVWWLGFDCAHSGDMSPGYGERYRTMGDWGTYKDCSYVEKEVCNLARQLAEPVHT